MKIRYLGTGSAEGVPAFFCHCEVCRYAGEHGSREIRTRAQALLDDTILLDIGPDTYLHILAHRLDLTEMEHCLVTHVHEDHFYAPNLYYRQAGFANIKEGTRPLIVYGSRDVQEALQLQGDGMVTPDGSVLFQGLHPYEPVEIAGYRVTALPAYHATENPFIFWIEKDGKHLLYAHDTDIFYGEVWEYLEKEKVQFDLVSMDCTEGLKDFDYHGHMNLKRNLAVKERMLKSGLAFADTLFVASHFSHNGQATYKEICKAADGYGIMVAYDGMEVEF